MSLYNDWTQMVIDYVKHKGEAAFWKEYGGIEKNIYSRILSNHNNKVTGVLKELAEQYDTTPMFFMGFLDGINDSLTNPLNLEETEEDANLELDIDFEKLYFNMLDAKADYLYHLPQWAGIFSPEKRKGITKQYRESKVIVNTNKIGRNDPCPCGSGKKYKKCCGRNINEAATTTE